MATEYDLLERIGTGGMAEVFRARRRGLHGFERVVALKRIHAEVARDEITRSMFVEEARLAASLCHKNLVQVFDFGEQDSEYYMAMELVDGTDLSELLSRERRLPVPVALYVAAELCEGLAYMHARGVVHRDVNPGNIFISRSGEVKLGDFGIAKARARAIRTERGMIKGKLGYLSPEQARGEDAEPRSDVYAVGLVLFEMLTGQRYLMGDSEASLLYFASIPKRKLPSEVAPDLGERLDALSTRFVAPDRADRFASAQMAVDAIMDVAASIGGLASPADLAARVAGVTRARKPPSLPSPNPTPVAHTAQLRDRTRWGPIGTAAFLGLAAAIVGFSILASDDPPVSPPTTPRAQSTPARAPAPTPTPPPERSTTVTAQPSGVDSQIPTVPSPSKTDSPSRSSPRKPTARPAPSQSPGVLPPVSTPTDEASKAAATEAALQELLAVENSLRARGILPADASAIFERLRALRQSIGNGAPFGPDLTALQRDVESLQVDRAFIERKTARLHAAMAAAKLSPEQDQRANRLAQTALEATLDGRIAAANDRLNELARLLGQ